jgi:hypothetical protein
MFILHPDVLVRSVLLIFFTPKIPAVDNNQTITNTKSSKTVLCSEPEISRFIKKICDIQKWQGVSVMVFNGNGLSQWREIKVTIFFLPCIWYTHYFIYYI